MHNIIKKILVASIVASCCCLNLQAQDNAFAKSFVETYLSSDGKTFLTEDEKSQYELWNADGSLRRRFADYEADVATISGAVRPLGIEYPVIPVFLRFCEGR